jgi:hypothetical protein
LKVNIKVSFLYEYVKDILSASIIKLSFHIIENPASYGTWRFITMFTRARHWTLSWARWIQLVLTSCFFHIILQPVPSPPCVENINSENTEYYIQCFQNCVWTFTDLVCCWCVESHWLVKTMWQADECSTCFSLSSVSAFCTVVLQWPLKVVFCNIQTHFTFK